MTVYVDNARVRDGRRTQYAYCHMAADSLQELHVFAQLLQIRRFHNHPEHPHYDVNDWQRALVLQAGAVEVRPRELLTIALCAKRNA